MHLILSLLPLVCLASANSVTPQSSVVQGDIAEDYVTGETVSSEDVKEDLPSTVSNNLQTNDPVASELVENLLHGAFVGRFNALNLLESFQPSDCLQLCLDEVGSMLEQPFAGQRSVDEVGNICSHFDVFQRCLHHNSTCKNALLGVTTSVFDHLCTVELEALGDVLPCLYSHSTLFYYMCDSQCKLGDLLIKTSKENEVKATDLLNNGSRLLGAQNLHNLCSSSACFASCIQEKMEKDCSLVRSSILHKVVAAVVNHTMTLNPIPEMKSSDAYTLLVSSALPQECQRLRLLPESTMNTAAVTDMDSDTEYEADDVLNKSVASGESGAARMTSDDLETERPKAVYEQNLSINDRKMKLQCQLVDVLTGQGATVTDAATLMTTAAKNILNEFGFRSVEDDQKLENYVKYGNMSGFSDRITSINSERSEKEVTAASCRVFPSILLSLSLSLIFHMG